MGTPSVNSPTVTNTLYRCDGCGHVFASAGVIPLKCPGCHVELQGQRHAKPLSEDERLKHLRETREAVYGDAAGNHECTGMLWTAILQYHYRIKFDHPIPPHIVCLLLGAMKVERAAAPFEFHQDNYDDAVNYVRMAAEVDARNPLKEKP
jgi:hypothetical protein